MQEQNQKLRNDKKTDNAGTTGRVVNLRAWKARKRLQTVRGQQSWPLYLLRIVNYLVAAGTGLFAVASCVPFWWQLQSVIMTWFLGCIGCALGLWQYVLRQRYAREWLAYYTIAFALSLAAAIVKLLIV